MRRNGSWFPLPTPWVIRNRDPSLTYKGGGNGESLKMVRKGKFNIGPGVQGEATKTYVVRGESLNKLLNEFVEF